MVHKVKIASNVKLSKMSESFWADNETEFVSVPFGISIGGLEDVNGDRLLCRCNVLSSASYHKKHALPTH
jgi:hypothetical protein